MAIAAHARRCDAAGNSANSPQQSHAVCLPRGRVSRARSSSSGPVLPRLAQHTAVRAQLTESCRSGPGTRPAMRQVLCVSAADTFCTFPAGSRSSDSILEIYLCSWLSAICRTRCSSRTAAPFTVPARAFCAVVSPAVLTPFVPSALQPTSRNSPRARRRSRPTPSTPSPACTAARSTRRATAAPPLAAAPPRAAPPPPSGAACPWTLPCRRARRSPAAAPTSPPRPCPSLAQPPAQAPVRLMALPPPVCLWCRVFVSCLCSSSCPRGERDFAGRHLAHSLRLADRGIAVLPTPPTCLLRDPKLVLMWSASCAAGCYRRNSMTSPAVNIPQLRSAGDDVPAAAHGFAQVCCMPLIPASSSAALGPRWSAQAKCAHCTCRFLLSAPGAFSPRRSARCVLGVPAPKSDPLFLPLCRPRRPALQWSRSTAAAPAAPRARSMAWTTTAGASCCGRAASEPGPRAGSPGFLVRISY